MSKLEIAKKLKECRKKTGLTIFQVGEQIGKSGKTVSAWENGRGQPDADMFLILCEIYGVKSVGIFFGENQKSSPKTMEPIFQSKRLEYLIKTTGKDNIVELSAQAGVDVMKFTHWLTGQVQPSQENVESLAQVLGVTYDYLMGLTNEPKETVAKKETEQTLVNSFRLLNDEGQEKIIDYIDDLVTSGKYVKKVMPETTRIFRAARSEGNSIPQIRDMSPERAKEFEEVEETDEI